MATLWSQLKKKVRYPKFIILGIIIFLTYIIFSWIDIKPLLNGMLSLGYGAAIVAGMFYSYGFTAPAATGLLYLMASHFNIFLAAILGGIGSFITDYILFKIIRTGFDDEVDQLSREPFVKNWGKKLNVHIKKFVVPIIGAIIIASPLPDEIGVTLIAADKDISSKWFGVMSFVLNGLGILVIFLLGLH